MNPVSIRLLNQQLAAPQFGSPAEVVSRMGAMQAQDYRQQKRQGIKEPTFHRTQLPEIAQDIACWE